MEEGGGDTGKITNEVKQNRLEKVRFNYSVHTSPFGCIERESIYIEKKLMKKRRGATSWCIVIHQRGN